MNEIEFNSKSCKKGFGGWKKEELQMICRNLNIKFKKTDNKDTLCNKIQDHFKPKTLLAKPIEPSFLPVEMFLEIIKNSDIENIKSLCETNKLFNTYCKENDKYIIKFFLKKYKVDYEDPNNLIYEKLSLKKAKTIIKESNLKEIFKLYLKYYNKNRIICKTKRSITSVPILPNVEIFECNNNNLEKLNEMDKLEYLECNNNKLKELPYLPNVSKIICKENKLNEIPSLPNLDFLECSSNNIKKLNDFPKLDYLKCSDNKISEIPNYPKLKTLYCDDNLITTISALSNLKVLTCNNNRITELAEFPKLISLFCGSNNISRIPVYNKLEHLYCPRNIITELPELPKLNFLICDLNRITRIPYYPKIDTLTCAGNNIQEIPDNLPSRLRDLYNNCANEVGEIDMM